MVANHYKLSVYTFGNRIIMQYNLFFDILKITVSVAGKFNLINLHSVCYRDIRLFD